MFHLHVYGTRRKNTIYGGNMELPCKLAGLVIYGPRLWLRLRDTRACAVRNVLGNVYLILLTKNVWYEGREQLDSGGGGALSQGAGHEGSFF